MTGATPSRPPTRGSGLSLGRPFGIPVFVSPSWFLVAAYITFSFGVVVDRQVGDLGPLRYAVSAGFAVLIFLSVLGHELGHCVVSRAFGLPVRRLTIFLLGFTAWSNLLVAGFNLLPGLPLDGGRILRAALWRLTSDKWTGTRAAAYVGRGVAGLVLLFALLSAYDGRSGSLGASGNVVLFAVLAIFIYSGAGQALRAAAVGSRLPGVSARALARRAVLVSGDQPLSEAVRQANEVGARGIVVIDSVGRPYGVVSESAVASTPVQRRPWMPVSALARMLDAGLTLDADLQGAAVLDAMRSAPATEYVVTEPDGSVVGVLTATDVAAALEAPAMA